MDVISVHCTNLIYCLVLRIKTAIEFNNDDHYSAG
jgi:hypothetical protein